VVPEGCAFALVGRDERATLPRLIEAVRAVARPGDEVWFVDSASSDGSAEVAGEHGVEVIEAPEGKGAAVGAALDRWDAARWLCLLDADLIDGARAARRLRAAIDNSDAAMIVGERSDPPGRRRLVTPRLYFPLVSALFPEVEEPRRRPLSGLRALSVRPDGPLAPGYGIEAHLNVAIALDGGRTEVVDLGDVPDAGRAAAHGLRVGREVASALLDLAIRAGRLSAAARAEWDAWVEGTIAGFDRAQPAAERPVPSSGT
jgi:glucosyl-3-phosphoglycerate synthase